MLMQEVAPDMIRQRSGRIVVVGSITATLASPFNGAYAVWPFNIRPLTRWPSEHIISTHACATKAAEHNR